MRLELCPNYISSEMEEPTKETELLLEDDTMAEGGEEVCQNSCTRVLHASFVLAGAKPKNQS